MKAPPRSVEVDDRVIVDSPGTAWHSYRATVRDITTHGRCVIVPDGHPGLTAWFWPSDLRLLSAVDRLAELAE
jgi:hypothetical protein